MGSEFDQDLREAVRSEAYRPPLGLDAANLRSRVQSDERRRAGRRRRIVVGAVAVVAIVAAGVALWPPPPAGPSAGQPTEASCAESTPTTSGGWWVEVGGPNAHFNIKPGSLSAVRNWWQIIVRFDPDATTGAQVAMSAQLVGSEQPVMAVLNSRIDPRNLYDGSLPAPDLPGGWYLFEQGLPTPGCWRLTASIDGRVAGSATVNVQSRGPSADAPPSLAAPTPGTAAPTGTPTAVAGGCGGTQVFAGPGPDANLGLWDNPWAAAIPASAGIVAYFWYPPPGVLFATDSSGDSPKVLWVSHAQAGELSVSAHPLGASTPVVRFTFGAATSPTGNYPSLVALPSPGCWHFDLSIGTARAAMDLLVAPAPPPASPSPQPSPSAAVSCIPEPAEVAPGGSGDPCPMALAAVEAAVAPLALPVTRIYIQPGIFWCGVLWPGLQSTPVCAGPLIVPGARMHGWVAFAGTAKVAAVGLSRTPPHGSTPGGPWKAGVAAFTVPPDGWVMP